MSEILRASQAMGILPGETTRASDLERQQVVTYLREAHADGRLTGDQFHARADAANAAETRLDLARLTTDLPASVRREHRITRAADAVVELHEEHHALFHGGIMLVALAVMIACTGIDWAIAGISQTFVSNWGVLPAVSYVFGAVAIIISGVAWACE